VEEEFNSNQYSNEQDLDQLTEEMAVAQTSAVTSLAKFSNSLNRSTFRPKFAGVSNAFAIQLFCIEDKYDSR
jgi:hypothetical protein